MDPTTRRSPAIMRSLTICRRRNELGILADVHPNLAKRHSVFHGQSDRRPESQDEIWQAHPQRHGLKARWSSRSLIAVLENHNHFSTGGEFDYAYNFAPNRRPIGHTALLLSAPPSSASGHDPLSASSQSLLPDGANVWSLTFSATVTTIPEPPTWLMLMAGGVGLLVIRGLARRPGVGAPSSRLRRLPRPVLVEEVVDQLRRRGVEARRLFEIG